MMTTQEKIQMFKEKKAFIGNLSKAFKGSPSASTVESVAFEVYRKEINEHTTYFAEYLVVNFFGGGKSVRSANGNSSLVNFTELGKIIHGGYYDEVRDYETILDRGFVKVNLQEDV